jgi:hypothetical protein
LQSVAPGKNRRKADAACRSLWLPKDPDGLQAARSARRPRDSKADFLRVGQCLLELGKPGRTGLKRKPHTGLAGRSPGEPFPILNEE